MFPLKVYITAISAFNVCPCLNPIAILEENQINLFCKNLVKIGKITRLPLKNLQGYAIFINFIVCLGEVVPNTNFLRYM
jgi:hypothetical protein